MTATLRVLASGAAVAQMFFPAVVPAASSTPDIYILHPSETAHDVLVRLASSNARSEAPHPALDELAADGILSEFAVTDHDLDMLLSATQVDFDLADYSQLFDDED
jgi:hypothetical protein